MLQKRINPFTINSSASSDYSSKFRKLSSQTSTTTSKSSKSPLGSNRISTEPLLKRTSPSQDFTSYTSDPPESIKYFNNVYIKSKLLDMLNSPYTSQEVLFSKISTMIRRLNAIKYYSDFHVLGYECYGDNEMCAINGVSIDPNQKGFTKTTFSNKNNPVILKKSPSIKYSLRDAKTGKITNLASENLSSTALNYKLQRNFTALINEFQGTLNSIKALMEKELFPTTSELASPVINPDNYISPQMSINSVMNNQKQFNVTYNSMNVNSDVDVINTNILTMQIKNKTPKLTKDILSMNAKQT